MPLRHLHRLPGAAAPAPTENRTVAPGGRRPARTGTNQTPAGFHPERCRTSREIPVSAAHHGNPHQLDPGNHSPATDLFVPGSHTARCRRIRTGPTALPCAYTPPPLRPGRRKHHSPRTPGKSSHPGDGRLLRSVNRPRGGQHVHADAAAPLPQRLCPLPGAVNSSPASMLSSDPSPNTPPAARRRR